MGCTSNTKKQDRDPASVSVLAQKQAQAQKLSSRNSLEELTGKKSKIPYSDAQLKKMPLSAQHYYAGLKAAEAKNYILAIKQYNTVVKRYSKSKEVRLALIAKSNLYKEMGLREPASLNLKLAQQSTKLNKIVSVKPNPKTSIQKKSAQLETDTSKN